MDGIFKRLTRLARAELNDLSDRLARADAKRRGERPRGEARGEAREGDGSSGQGPRAAARPQTTPPRWPREIRAAYAALELPLGAGRDEVRAAYRKLLARYHPDRHQAEPEKLATANELTRRIREQYELLDRWLAQRAGG